MISRCIFVVLFVILGTPSAELNCSSWSHMKTCDECIKCGGIWCKNVQEPQKCVSVMGGGDEWCPNPNDREIVSVAPNSRDGAIFSPQYEEILAEINSGKITTLQIDGTVTDNKSLHFKVMSSKSVDKLKVHVKLESEKSQIEVTTTMQHGFCSETSQAVEKVSVEIDINGVDEKAVLTYHVPCACACSSDVEPRSPACGGFGELMCGTCRCDRDRHGKYCECGKASSSCVDSTSKKCSGNGYCDKCNICQCNEHVKTPGTERFDQQDNCKDMITSAFVDFTSCLGNSKVACGTCDHDIVFQNWNASLSVQRDGDKDLWVDLIAATGLPYLATRVNGKIHAMRKPQYGC